MNGKGSESIERAERARGEAHREQLTAHDLVRELRRTLESGGAVASSKMSSDSSTNNSGMPQTQNRGDSTSDVSASMAIDDAVLFSTGEKSRQAVAQLKEHLAREVMYRQALEKQLANAHVRRTVDEAEERYKLAKDEMIVALRKQLADAEEELQKRPPLTEENKSQVELAQRVKVCLDEVANLQKDLAVRTEENAELKTQLARAEEARSVAEEAASTVKQALIKLEGERKTLRAQIVKLKNLTQAAPVRLSATQQRSGEEILAYQEQIELLTRQLDEQQAQHRTMVQAKDKFIEALREDLHKVSYKGRKRCLFLI